tara:strand:- start:205 stop:468 length:264 start_codon:yes stop_codon:yes gene_type:complete
MSKSRWPGSTVGFSSKSLIHGMVNEGDLVLVESIHIENASIVGIYMGKAKRGSSSLFYYQVLYKARLVTLDPACWTMKVLNKLSREN